jgi:hypothetical protein
MRPSQEEALERIRSALEGFKRGGHVEDMLDRALGPLRELLVGALRSRGLAQDEPSITEAAYRLHEAGQLSEEDARLLAELSRMREMAHYDIYAEYTREQIAAMWARALEVLGALLGRYALR